MADQKSKTGCSTNRGLRVEIISTVLVMMTAGLLLYGQYERTERTKEAVERAKQTQSLLENSITRYSSTEETPFPNFVEYAQQAYNESIRKFRIYCIFSGLVCLLVIWGTVRTIRSQRQRHN